MAFLGDFFIITSSYDDGIGSAGGGALVCFCEDYRPTFGLAAADALVTCRLAAEWDASYGHLEIFFDGGFTGRFPCKRVVHHITALKVLAVICGL